MPEKKRPPVPPKARKPRQRKEAAPSSVIWIEEPYDPSNPPTPEEWEALRWFQAMVRAALAQKVKEGTLRVRACTHPDADWQGCPDCRTEMEAMQQASRERREANPTPSYRLEYHADAARGPHHVAVFRLQTDALLFTTPPMPTLAEAKVLAADWIHKDAEIWRAERTP